MPSGLRVEAHVLSFSAALGAQKTPGVALRGKSATPGSLRDVAVTGAQWAPGMAPKPGRFGTYLSHPEFSQNVNVLFPL